MAAGDCAWRVSAGALQATMLYAKDQGAVPLVWLHASPQTGSAVLDLIETPCALACVEGADWNRDLSPWPAARVFARGADFAGGAPAYLPALRALMEQAESSLPFPQQGRYLTGYSLAGLFALYAWLQGLPLDGVGSFSGSVWFDGFADWAMDREPAPARLALSVGDRERRTGNPRMARVEDCTRLLAGHWAKKMPVRFWLEKGGHFDHTDARMARGINWLLGLAKE